MAHFLAQLPHATGGPSALAIRSRRLASVGLVRTIGGARRRRDRDMQMSCSRHGVPPMRCCAKAAGQIGATRTSRRCQLRCQRLTWLADLSLISPSLCPGVRGVPCCSRVSGVGVDPLNIISAVSMSVQTNLSCRKYCGQLLTAICEQGDAGLKGEMQRDREGERAARALVRDGGSWQGSRWPGCVGGSFRVGNRACRIVFPARDGIVQ
eukprot:365091-Chlamydomonas_euryale.AAC.20